MDLNTPERMRGQFNVGNGSEFRKSTPDLRPNSNIELVNPGQTSKCCFASFSDRLEEPTIQTSVSEGNVERFAMSVPPRAARVE